MYELLVGDIVIHIDGGHTGKIIFISEGKAMVQFANYPKEFELQYLALVRSVQVIIKAI